MARYSVYRLKSGELMVDCQADVLAHFATRVVAPLLLPSEVPRPMSRLNPKFRIDGLEFVMGTHLLGAIYVDDIAEEVTSLSSRDSDIAKALDFLMMGF